MTYRKPQSLTHSHLVNFTMSWPLRYEVEVRLPSRPLERKGSQKSPAKSSPIILRRETRKFPQEMTWVVSTHSLSLKSGHLLVEWFCFCWSHRGEERERFPSTEHHWAVTLILKGHRNWRRWETRPWRKWILHREEWLVVYPTLLGSLVCRCYQGIEFHI